MSNRPALETFEVPLEAHSVSHGTGSPVVLIHGLAASLHDWDLLIPVLVEQGYSTHALDLLGHGQSPKPKNAAYELAWLIEHFIGWMNGLNLKEPPVLIAHSLGGYLALEYARRFPERVRGLVLVDPFYTNTQLPAVLRLAYALPGLSSFFIKNTPAWGVRLAIDVMSMMIGHSKGGLHALPEAVRAQTAQDYMQTAPATYAIVNAALNLTPYLPSIHVPTLVLWGERDRTLSPASFEELIRQLPRAAGKSRRTGHVLHQAESEWFNREVIAFLSTLAQEEAGAKTPLDSRATPPLRLS